MPEKIHLEHLWKMKVNLVYFIINNIYQYLSIVIKFGHGWTF